MEGLLGISLAREVDITANSGEDIKDLVDSDDRDDFNPAGDDEDL